MKIKNLFFVLIFFCASNLLHAQIIHPVKWNFSVNRISKSEAELIFKAKIDDGSSLYSQDVPKDGPIPTTFVFEKNTDFSLIGKTLESKSIIKQDQNFDMKLKVFKHEAVFTQKIKILSGKTFSIKGTVDFMVCDEFKCSRDNAEFNFNIEKSNLPATADTVKKISAKQDTSKIKLEEKNDSEKNISLNIKKENAVVQDIDSSDNHSLLIFFLLAFLGGLAAILMPCIFPMIPMTVSFFLRGSENKLKARSQALVFSLSIVLIYTAIGLGVTFSLGPDFINWLSTHWIPNLFFFLIFITFSAAFFGMFELTLPNWLINKSDKQAEKGGFAGSFFMAFTLVLISFSCTVPIVGTILVEASRGEVIKPVIGMLGFSLAFALPFGFFAFFPSTLSSLPKSGGWLNSVKIVFGFVELALGMKFLMVIDQVYHLNVISREVYLSIWIVVFTLMGFYLLGKIKFAHDTEVKHIGIPRLILVIITFTFVVYLIPGLIGAPLSALSGYIPPPTSQNFDLNSILKNNSSKENESVSSLCEKPKYDNFLHLSYGLEGYFEYQQALQCAKKLHKPLFIDFTGHGCVNCWKMEQNVISDPRVLKRLKEKFVISVLYVDEKKSLPQSQWVKSTYDGKMKKEIGAINSDIQAKMFNSNSQPFYVVVDTSGKLLVQPKAFDMNVENYIRFLDDASETFNKQSK